MAYVDGFVAAVPNAKRDAYVKHATEAAKMFRKHGAQQVVECWGDDVPDGKLTSFPMAVKKEADETVIFSWVTWPSKDVRDAAWKAMMEDQSMKPEDMPFDGKRMIYGGFTVVVDA